MLNNLLRALACVALLVLPLSCCAEPVTFTGAGDLSHFGSQISVNKHAGEVDIITPQSDSYQASLALNPVGVKDFRNASGLPGADVKVDPATKAATSSHIFIEPAAVSVHSSLFTLRHNYLRKTI